MAADSKILAVETAAIRAFIATMGDRNIEIDGKLYRAVKVANVTNARSGKQIVYREWFNSCHPVPVSDCTLILHRVTYVDGVEVLKSAPVWGFTYKNRDAIKWVAKG